MSPETVAPINPTATGMTLNDRRLNDTSIIPAKPMKANNIHP